MDNNAFIKNIIWLLPYFILLLLVAKANKTRSKRAYQYSMPYIALVYSIVAVIYLDKINTWLLELARFIGKYLSFFNNIDWEIYMIFFSNIILVLGFLLLKSFLMPIVSGIWKKSSKLCNFTSGVFYEHDEEYDLWFIKNDLCQFKVYLKGIYISAVVVTSLLLFIAKTYPGFSGFSVPFYPVMCVLILGEVSYFLGGLTKSEFVEDILGDDDASSRILNYSLLCNVFRKLFSSRILHDSTEDNSAKKVSNFELLERLKNSDSATEREIGQYYDNLKAEGADICPNYVTSSIALMNGKSVLYCNPFYRDLTVYTILPLLKRLMNYEKCLVIVGRESSSEDVRQWLSDGIFEMTNTSSLWNVKVLERQPTDVDVGVLKISDIYNMELLDNNDEFISKVGFVILIEPSRVLATGQAGLNLIVDRFAKPSDKIVYSAIDRNCDGLVDSLSHTLKANFTEVSATNYATCCCSAMFWEADGPYMHHKILPSISRYLGIGSEINTTALKYAVSNPEWISNSKFPVVDMKWILGQYYRSVCEYANLPISQDEIYNSLSFSSDLWAGTLKSKSFITVEDEFCNLFESARMYSSRAADQGFVNVISENYLLRDYMVDNSDLFSNDPKCIPSIVSDYARTERNTVIKLLMRMNEQPVCEEKIRKEFEISGIETDNIYTGFVSLIEKHCGIKDPGLQVFLREEIDPESLKSVTRKYVTFQKSSNIALYAKIFKNAYFIAEDEKSESLCIGAKLYGHVFQSLLPGQFVTYDGKYYEVSTITPGNDVVVRRAADHITKRRYYRQLRSVTVANVNASENMGSIYTLSDIVIEHSYADITVSTAGYREFDTYNDLKNSRKVFVNNIPDRTFKNKEFLKITLPNSSDKVRYTVCLFLNEIFKTLFPETSPYISALTTGCDGLAPELTDLMFSLSVDKGQSDDSIYIIEDSEIDLGLISSVERNLERCFGIISEYIYWGGSRKSVASPVNEAPVERIEKPWAVEKKKETRAERKARKKAEKEAKRLEKERRRRIRKGIPEPEDETEAYEGPEDSGDDYGNIEADGQSEYDTEDTPITEDIGGDDDDAKEIPVDSSSENFKYLNFGFDELNSAIDLESVSEYLRHYGFNVNPLSQARENANHDDAIDDDYDPTGASGHLCDFCGEKLGGGEYNLLKDGRERCTRCSRTSITTIEEFREIFNNAVRNMESFYGIKLNVAVKVRTTDARKIARETGSEFVATPGFDGRVLGFARHDKDGYSLYVENGSPRLAAIATITHELTHIWQYQNWDRRKIRQLYGKENELFIYEGMAKWAEIQYLMYINEVSYGKRLEVSTALRQDEYGEGFKLFRDVFPLSYSVDNSNTSPFDRYPPIAP